MQVNPEVRSQLDRAREMCQDLEAEYAARIREDEVHPRILNLAVDILVKLRSVLDHTASRIFEAKIQPCTTRKISSRRIQFPITDSETNFEKWLKESAFGQLAASSPTTLAIIREVQPFARLSQNKWLKDLRDLSNEGKHVRLVPQEKHARERVTVKAPFGSTVSWSGATFGPGVRIMGVPVDPSTQNIVPTPGYTSRRDVLVAFLFTEPHLDALAFLRDAIGKIEGLVTRLHNSL